MRGRATLIVAAVACVLVLTGCGAADARWRANMSKAVMALALEELPAHWPSIVPVRPAVSEVRHV